MTIKLSSASQISVFLLSIEFLVNLDCFGDQTKEVKVEPGLGPWKEGGLKYANHWLVSATIILLFLIFTRISLRLTMEHPAVGIVVVVVAALVSPVLVVGVGVPMVGPGVGKEVHEQGNRSPSQHNQCPVGQQSCVDCNQAWVVRIDVLINI